jgi:hypothetical protein
MMTRLDKALASVVFVCLAVLWIFSGWVWGKGITALFFSSFVVQSALLGLYAYKVHKRLAINWALLCFVMNIGVFIFFDIHMPGILGFDNFAELSTVITITTITIFITLILLQNDPNQVHLISWLRNCYTKGFSDCVP